MGLLMRWLSIIGLHVPPPPKLLNLLGPLDIHMHMSDPVHTPAH